jgi:hypothetical protein
LISFPHRDGNSCARGAYAARLSRLPVKTVAGSRPTLAVIRYPWPVDCFCCDLFLHMPEVKVTCPVL